MVRIWLPVVLIGILSLAGLVLALVADDRWNWLCALLLAPGVLVATRTMALSIRRGGKTQ